MDRWFQNDLNIFPISGNSLETGRRLAAEVFIPGKRATPTSVAKYLYSINGPAHPALPVSAKHHFSIW